VALACLALASACSSDGATQAPDASSTDTGHAGQSGDLVMLADGPVQGLTRDGVRRFLGVPYAAPPVGDLRWREPRAVTPWAEPLDATAIGSPCPQTGLFGDASLVGDEDCLSLNVYTPETVGGGPLPVMVWIHGGAFEKGNGHENGWYDGSELVRAGGVVVVTVNYRIGALGFLADAAFGDGTQTSRVGNFGLLDQQAALRWVHDNIAELGGDPGDVTLFGESAGGMSICTHLVAPSSAGLFHRAIIQSGPCGLFTASRSDAQSQADTLADALGCDGSDRAACLRGKSVDQLVRALPPKAGFFFGPGVNWGPVVDGDLLPEFEPAAFERGQVAKVPVLLGTNRDEGALFTFLANFTAIDDDGYAAILAAEPGTAAHVSAIRQRYPSSDYPSPAAALAATLADRAFVCPARGVARALTARSEAPVFMYHFTYEASRSPFGSLGVVHTAEISFVFGNPMIGGALNETDRTVVRTVMGSWTRFVATNSPSDADSPWPAYEPTREDYLELAQPPRAGAKLRASQCDFWDSLRGDARR
jgi:para-nitrobenzyl esterase